MTNSQAYLRIASKPWTHHELWPLTGRYSSPLHQPWSAMNQDEPITMITSQHQPSWFILPWFMTIHHYNESAMQTLFPLLDNGKPSSTWWWLHGDYVITLIMNQPHQPFIDQESWSAMNQDELITSNYHDYKPTSTILVHLTKIHEPITMIISQHQSS